MPAQTILEISAETQAQMLAELRGVHYGYFLALHILLLCAAGKSPTEIAEFLFCSRERVYRAVEAYRAGTFRLAAGVAVAAGPEPQASQVVLTSVPRSLLALVKRVPHSLGWCRTRSLLCHPGSGIEAAAGSESLQGEDQTVVARTRL